ncbi:protein MALE DISCOVERER 2-like isoform X2 [Aristolochia californica]|uniref:protein MALE DISCOVERER 2-like isoform X2 n=1 Tax=Aristolochia californica TaxID=171875 RepID=UPI0035D727A7
MIALFADVVLLQGFFCFAMVLHAFVGKCWSLNDEGRLLLAFRAKVETDPFGSLVNWDPFDANPCNWAGIYCRDGHVSMLNLKKLSLVGVLAPEIGKLSHLTALVLYKNYFTGEIPKEIASLTMLQLLDLRNNSLNGRIPAEIGYMPSLKRLLLCENRFEGNMPSELEKFKMLSQLQCDVAVNRKVGHWFRSGKGSSHCYRENCIDTETGSTEPRMLANAWNLKHSGHRKLLGVFSSNLAALPAPWVSVELIFFSPYITSGSFLATTSPNGNTNKPLIPTGGTSQNVQPISTISPSHSASDNINTDDVKSRANHVGKWKYILLVVAFALLIATIIIFMCRSKGVATIGPWKTGLSGQLQKAFVIGVPKLNRAELEIACEDFSNIIATVPECKLYKGTLSSGVEIAVASTSIQSCKDWSKRAEQHFRKKIDVFSRVNHKNFVNLLGYCEEYEPFLRLMAFEYAPSGSLYEHLHVKDVEHLDWAARMRIIMGISYCLQYMHHELNPPVVHSNLQSDCVFLTDDYAAKVTEVGFWKDLVTRGKIISEDDHDLSELPPADTENNVYSFGLLLLEIISGKLPYSEEQGSLLNWAIEYLNDKRRISYMIDPNLKSFKTNELDVICEVIQECIHHDPRQRSTMREVTLKLKEALGISADAATPRLSPLWWAELEILSMEAS